METQAKDLQLYVSTNRCSGYCLMVELALKLKGVAYEYVLEDLLNKSPSLLRYNPVHKKVPVLVHRGRPVAESLVILQYVDETWPEPQLLPSDPYESARVRFWVEFFYSKIALTSKKVLLSQGEEFDEALSELKEQVMTMEEGLKLDFPSKGPFFNGATPGLLDVVLGSCFGGGPIVEEMVGVELFAKDSTPFMSSRTAAFGDLEVAKETLPPRAVYLEYARTVREKYLACSKA